MSSTNIAIFNNAWQVIAFISQEGADMLNTCDGQDKNLLSWVLAQLEDRDPQLMEPVKDESGCITGFVSVGRGEPRYLEAVRDELRRVGLRAHEVATSLVPLFSEISSNKAFEHFRTQVVPEVLGLDEEHAKLALETVMHVGEVRNET